MGVIKLLDKHMSELIAAGEVIERPSSVIKELVENSIDSGAKHITVEIQRGGITFMRVTDDGCGIAREDIPTAFLRHATSKVHDKQDLDAIGTLGFRGEALASIAAVAKVTMLSCRENEEIGTRYEINGGDEIEIDDAGCPKGTTIIARDIFYNVPARMKFLKKDVSEANSVSGVIDRIALSHPEISFTFIRDGKQTMKTPGDDNLKNAILSVFGKEFTSTLIPLNYQHEGIKLQGYITRPISSRANRSMQLFFINGRYIKTRTAMAALEEAYKGNIMTGKFPGCVLHMTMDYSTLDVNVHPSKLEVRFTNERPIFDAVYHGVKSALLSGDNRSPIKEEEPIKPEILEKTATKAENEQLQFSYQPKAAKPVEKSDKISEKDSVFKGDSKKEYSGKIVFTNDGTHPTYDGGHPIYTKTLSRSLLQMNKAQEKAHALKAPLYPGNYEKAKMIPVTEFEHSEGWKLLSKDDKAFSNFQGDQKALPVVLESSDSEDFVKVHFKGIRVGVFDLIGPSSGGMTVEIDQNDPSYIRRFDKYCGDRNRTNYCLFESLNEEEHTIIIRPDNRRFEKAEIYKMNPKRIKETEYFNEFNTYLGYILLVGDIIQN